MEVCKMLLPLFDKDCEHAGWLDPGKYIYDADMNFIAFIINSNAWSVETGNWLGPVQGLLCYDTNGKLMFWNPKEKITGTVNAPRPSRQILSTKPQTPAKPAEPAKPAPPKCNANVWSDLSLWGWLSQ